MTQMEKLGYKNEVIKNIHDYIVQNQPEVQKQAASSIDMSKMGSSPVTQSKSLTPKI